ncbi:protein FLX-like 2 [Mangifera indica]|uniref:protein FLX-like 2 n=1 Tax=Mangifera indica TaxID=29780 RepID=UPI001CF9D9ED|nr:protein FLX-like 2 [Mangifera indica]
MGSKGRVPPPHLRRPLPGPGIMHPDSFGPGKCPMPGAFPPFDMLPPLEVMEQKIVAQHVEMQKLVTENQRLAATHGTLRQELAAAQHELQILHAQIGAMNSEREQQMRSLTDKIAKMEADLQAAEPAKLELQQAKTDAQNLVVAREELITKVRQLTQDLQRAHADVQQMPALMSELDSLRQEYHHCRATYEYEKKFYNDHLESLQVMDKNYITMAREVEKLRAELTNASNVDRRAGGPYGTETGNSENGASGRPVGQNAYEDGYGVPQGHGSLLPASAGTSTGVNASVSAPAFVGSQSGHPPPRAGYDAPRAPGYEPSKGPGYDAHTGSNYDAQRGHGYDIHRGPGYDAQRGPGYDPQRVAGYDPQRVVGYDLQRAHGYDAQRGQAYDMQRGPGYDSSGGASYGGPARGATAPNGQIALNNAPYGSATPPARSGSGHDIPPRGGHPSQRWA